MPPPTSSSPAPGANTVCELTAVGLPAVYVPLPIGNGEQRLNAADVVAAGGGLDRRRRRPDPGLDRHHAAPAASSTRPPRRDGRGLGGRTGARGADELLADLVVRAWRESESRAAGARADA